MGPECLDGAVLGLDGEADVEELLLVPDVGEGAAQAALKVVPGDVVVLHGSHDGGLYDAVNNCRNKTGQLWDLEHHVVNVVMLIQISISSQ